MPSTGGSCIIAAALVVHSGLDLDLPMAEAQTNDRRRLGSAVGLLPKLNARLLPSPIMVRAPHYAPTLLQERSEADASVLLIYRSSERLF